MKFDISKLAFINKSYSEPATYSDIKDYYLVYPSELECEKIYGCDLDSVLELGKSKRKMFSFPLAFVIFNIFAIIFLFFDIFLLSDIILSVAVFFTLFVFIFMLYCIFRELKSVPKNSDGVVEHKKAQYGILIGKEVVLSTDDNTTNLYATVKFESTKTYISKVYCRSEVYNQISIGDTVLVVSFDNSNADLIISYKNKF